MSSPFVTGRERDAWAKRAAFIRENGCEGGSNKPITYYDHEGRVYWTMGEPIEETTIINRCLKEDSYESRLASGNLPTYWRGNEVLA